MFLPKTGGIFHTFLKIHRHRGTKGALLCRGLKSQSHVPGEGKRRQRFIQHREAPSSSERAAEAAPAADPGELRSRSDAPELRVALSACAAFTYSCGARIVTSQGTPRLTCPPAKKKSLPFLHKTIKLLKYDGDAFALSWNFQIYLLMSSV